MKPFSADRQKVNMNHINQVGTGGFEPPKSKQQIYSLSHLATLVCPLTKKKSRRRDSNPRPADYKSAALPAELLRLFIQNLKNVPSKRDGKGTNTFMTGKKDFVFKCLFFYQFATNFHILILNSGGK